VREIKKIVIHCSDSTWGTSEDINRWHLERGWDGIGYHYVITNGRAKSTDSYKEQDDGLIEKGRPVEKTGAHVRGHNSDSIGVCLIGTHWFTSRQLYKSLPTLLATLMYQHKIDADNIFGHYELDKGKTCPNMNIEEVRYKMGEIKNVP
jgi:N-acetylmuramoyl-L-alanine amidase